MQRRPTDLGGGLTLCGIEQTEPVSPVALNDALVLIRVSLLGRDAQRRTHSIQFGTKVTELAG